MEQLDTRTKLCPRCRETKPTTEFQKDRTHSDGLKSSCKACRNQGRPSMPQKPKPTSQDAILIRAQSLAARQLIENHQREYKILVSAELKQLGFEPKWRQVS